MKILINYLFILIYIKIKNIMEEIIDFKKLLIIY